MPETQVSISGTTGVTLFTGPGGWAMTLSIYTSNTRKSHDAIVPGSQNRKSCRTFRGDGVDRDVQFRQWFLKDKKGQESSIIVIK